MALSQGAWYMVLAAFWFSVMAVFVKIAGRTIPSSEIVFVRALVSLVITFFLVRRKGLSLWGTNRRFLALRGLFGFLGLICFFYAVTQLPLADVTVIHFTNPVFTALLAALFLGEGMTRRDLGAALLCLAGVVMVARPSFLFGGHQSLPMFAVAMALAGAVFSSMAYVTVRKLGETDDPLVIVFYFPLIATPLSIPLMGTNPVIPTPVEWLWLLAVGVATQLAQVYLTKGLHAERAGRAMTVGYVQILFAAMWGITVFGERPHPWTYGGGLLVALGVILVAKRPPRRVSATASTNIT